MPERSLRFAASLMCRVRVNTTERRIHDGRPVIVKRRRPGSSIVISLGNLFLRLSHSGVRMFVQAAEWARWEAYCSSLLYPNRPGITLGPGSAITVVELPGTSLRQRMLHGQLDPRATVAAARELRRAHHLDCEYFGSSWSHGDLHLDNILYDSEADQAILVDFDTRHEFERDPVWRHGDDLTVFLLELLGLHHECWLELATAFLAEYGDAAVLEELQRHLVVPRGLAKILWYTRINRQAADLMEERLELLRQRIQRVVTVGCV